MTSSNFPRYWPFVREIHRSPVNFPHKGQWRGALAFSLICVWINAWVNNGEVGDLRRYHVHYDVTVMIRGSNYGITLADLHFLSIQTANSFWYIVDDKWFGIIIFVLLCLKMDNASTNEQPSTHLPWTKWQPFRRLYIEMHFREWKI